MNWDSEEDQQTKEQKRAQNISEIQEWMDRDPRVKEWIEAHLLCLRVTFSTMTAGDAEDALRRIPIYLRGLEHGTAPEKAEKQGPRSIRSQHPDPRPRRANRKSHSAGPQS